MEDHEHEQHGDVSAALLVEEDPADDLADQGLRSAEMPEAVRKVAAAGEKDVLTPDEVIDATAWLLEDDSEDEQPKVKTVRIRLRPGTVIPWTLRALSGPEYKQIRQASMGNREQRRKLIQQADPTGLDENRYHVLVVTQATVNPNLAEVAARKQSHPVAIVDHRFRHLPGVVQHLAGIVNDLSGYDPDLVDEEEEVAAAAAGNS